jgi:hypothetical protein
MTHLHAVVALLGHVDVLPIHRQAMGEEQLPLSVARHAELTLVQPRQLLEHLQHRFRKGDKFRKGTSITASSQFEVYC